MAGLPGSARLAQHWDEAIAAETRRGRSRLLGSYDAAYVGQLEKERGPITPEEHARLVVAAERGGVEGACRALELPAEAFMRVRRLWIERCAADPRVGAAARRAVAAEREKE